VAHVGGSECAVYRVGPDAVRSGVQVGDEFFPGVAGYFADAGLRVALFALPQSLPDARPAVIAADAAGNARTVNLGVRVTPRRFAEKTIPVSDDFLSRKVPELLAANDLDQSGDLVEGYLRINRELRARTEARVRAMCRDSAPAPLWQDAFLRLPNSAPLSGFADRRTYVHDGKTIDQQTHLGFDLASLRGSPVPAAHPGRDEAAATLARLGLDHEAVRAGRVGADAVAPLLAGADGAALAVALGELPSPEVAALLVALEPRAGERAVRKEIRRALYRLRQRGVPVPEPPAPAGTPRTPAAPEAEG